MESGSDISSVQESTDFDESGVMVLQATQVDDYQLRPSQLTKLCLWDYCACVDKMQISHALKPDSDADSSLDDEDSGSDDAESVFNLLGVMANRSSQWPNFKFLPAHCEHWTHVAKIRHPCQQLIPVPVDPTLLRHNRPSLKAHYSRAMLMLFKPWRCALDLHGDHGSWIDAFQSWKSNLPEDDELNHRVNNIVLLHECKEAHNHHYASQHHHGNVQVHVPSEFIEGADSENARLAQEIKNSLDDVDAIYAVDPVVEYVVRKNTQHHGESLICLLQMEQAG